MSSQSNNPIVNSSELSSIIQDWLDSAIENETKNAKEWIAQKLQEKIPDLSRDIAQSLASDISDYAESVSSFREDLAKAESAGMSRKEWLYRKLKEIIGEKSEEAFGQILEKLGNGLLSKLEKTVNEFGSQCSDGKKNALLTILPDNSPPTHGWNSESTKDRVFDISSVLAALTTSGLSSIDDSLTEKSETIRLSNSEKIKEALLKDDQSKLIMAITGALKEGTNKKILILDIGNPNAGSNSSTSTLPSPNADLPSLVNISSQLVEFFRQLLSGEVSPEKIIGRIIASAISAVVGIAKIGLSKYGLIILKSLFTVICPSSVIWKILFPILWEILAPTLGKSIANLAIKIGKTAKSFTHTIFNGLFSVGTILNGIKNVASCICSAISGRHSPQEEQRYPA